MRSYYCPIGFNGEPDMTAVFDGRLAPWGDCGNDETAQWRVSDSCVSGWRKKNGLSQRSDRLMTPPTDAATLGGVSAESKEYFEKRSLKKGAVNWVLLMSLGIAYVISGDFSGWNYGIGYGG